MMSVGPSSLLMAAGSRRRPGTRCGSGTWGHQSKITGLVLSPDGRRLATYAEDGTARVWDAETGAERHRIDQFGPYALFMVFSPDSRRLALGAYGGFPRTR